MSPVKIIKNHHRMNVLLDTGCTTNLLVLRLSWHLFKWWSAFGFLHRMICFCCHGVSEEHSAFLFRLNELDCVDAAVITWGAQFVNTLRTGDADLRFYITTVQDGWRKSEFLKRTCFPCTIHLIMQYIEPISEWFCWRMFIETWPHSELTFRHCASSI